MMYNLITDLSEFKEIHKSKDLSYVTIQNVNFTHYKVDWEEFIFHQTVFLGCAFLKEDFITIIEKGGFVFPKFQGLPFKPYRDELYHYKELMNGYNEEKDESRDLKIYEYFKRHQANPSIYDTLAQSIHDNSMSAALRKELDWQNDGIPARKVVGFMGGHSVERGNTFYTKVAMSAWKVAQAGYYVVTGGGPGIMEAANLGAYLANHSQEELLEAIDFLSEAPHYTSKGYISKAEQWVQKYPKGNSNLAIPTWFYGHEPSNLFATSIAKFFSNSIREDTLLTISLHGIVFAPGSAGTTQEIFQEAAQNHYGTFGYYSPMVFLGKKRYVEDTSLYSTLHQLAKGKEYKDLLYLTDDPSLVLKFIESHPPKKA